ncbi:hypothetical protein H0H81_005476 [Sphagnurus paluster]|uniref:Uncharacterized protein n=1 Tax=Sphagnurus paluster TaxID=117069 RepID=A0A9P7FY20_9AGAR|nr:hypothetical protein H0H81_005476 [Sphagnurus paluster]
MPIFGWRSLDTDQDEKVHRCFSPENPARIEVEVVEVKVIEAEIPEDVDTVSEPAAQGYAKVESWVVALGKDGADAAATAQID